MPQTRIGISGWNYPSWRGRFYPDRLPHKRELAYASTCFNSIEINGSFYSLKTPDAYRTWYEQTPRQFVFAVKGSRFITHMKKLKDVETALANFFASGVLLLREKLGPVLWQLPANMRFDAARLESFLHLLPRDTEEAEALARKHDARVRGRAWTKADRRRRIRHALEIRNESFFTPALVRLLRRFGVALVFSDSADWPYTEEVTGNFVYVRLHGRGKTYSSRYGAKELQRWAERLSAWRAGRPPDDAARITDLDPPGRKARDLYVYFDNDAKVWAPKDALELAARLGAEPEPGEAQKGPRVTARSARRRAS